MSVMTPPELQNSAADAFGKFANRAFSPTLSFLPRWHEQCTIVSGWTPGFAFILSFAGPLLMMGVFCAPGRMTQSKIDTGGYDAPIHVSEEASNASTAVSPAIVSSFVIAVLVGFGEFPFSFCLFISDFINSFRAQFRTRLQYGHRHYRHRRDRIDGCRSGKCGES